MITHNQREIINNEIIFLNIKDVMELTGWCEATVREIFANDKDFPAIKKGKEYQVEYSAFKEFFSKRRTNE